MIVNRYPKLIGIAGNAGTGKSTAAKFIKNFYSPVYDYQIRSFAAPLKLAATNLFGIEKLYFTSSELKEEEHPYWEMSPRVMLQKLGTECVREVFGENFFVARMEFGFIKDYDFSADVCVVIDDVRYQNEADWVVRNGGKIIRLTRPGFTGKVGVKEHASEAGIITTNFPFKKGVNYFEVENTGDLNSFRSNLSLLLKAFI